ncbi:hypothetical protein [Gorillibacterium massiliense]|uniref:hypothetical protein n=1 Tax=Gorillibacterium massiliense TaxID=1280390 RepID=UPI00059467D0|nr:hypothetical protein [Gorillibacterium massiliense]
MDNKHTYYVSVGSQEILDNAETANFDFEIRATLDEAQELMELFAEAEDKDEELISRAATPYESFEEIPAGKQDIRNDAYDDKLQDIYRLIYRYAVPETKDHIEKMGVL